MTGSPDSGLRKEASPVLTIAVAAALVLAAFVAVFFVFVKPGMDANRALSEFNTPEAQAKRDPDTRAFKPETQSLIDQLKAKEQHRTGTGATVRRRDQ